MRFRRSGSSLLKNLNLVAVGAVLVAIPVLLLRQSGGASGSAEKATPAAVVAAPAPAAEPLEVEVSCKRCKGRGRVECSNRLSYKNEAFFALSNEKFTLRCAAGRMVFDSGNEYYYRECSGLPQACSSCNGHGTVDCPACDGYGKVKELTEAGKRAKAIKDAEEAKIAAAKAAEEARIAKEKAAADLPAKFPALLESLRMVEIKPGTFEMGSPADEPGRDNDETRHTVTLTKPYWLSATEVTQTQYQTVMGENPSKVKGENLPVDTVSWEDAMKFCAQLTKVARTAGKLPAGYEYTLPTEAQWEYACRAGTTGAHAGDLDAMAWYVANASRSTHAVATKTPNAWGLYDMHGNVWEWCRDGYGDYPSGAVTDPMGDKTGAYRVSRGGSWFDSAAYCRSADRRGNSPANRSSDLGFRLCLSSVSQAE